MNILGIRLIGEGRLAVPEDRAAAIANFIKPTSKKGVRAFWGMTGYYRKFVPDYGKLAKPLTLLIRKLEPEQVQWTLEADQAFVELRKCLCNTCMLTIPDVSDLFRLHTDASGVDLGAVLSVIRREEELPVAYYSRQLKGAESHYSVTELECLSVVRAIQHFEVYLAGQHFELVTDHQALQGLTTSNNQNRRLTRWALFLQDFSFNVTYRPGPENTNADGLSRQCWRLEEQARSEAKISWDGTGLSGGRCGAPPQT